MSHISMFDKTQTAREDEIRVWCVSDPLLLMGGEVGDIEGHALLGGGGSGCCGGGGGESCPSSSEELSSVKSITSTFLLLLLLWLDEELRCSEPADVLQDPGQQQHHMSLCSHVYDFNETAK